MLTSERPGQKVKTKPRLLRVWLRILFGNVFDLLLILRDMQSSHNQSEVRPPRMQVV